MRKRVIALYVVGMALMISAFIGVIADIAIGGDNPYTVLTPLEERNVDTCVKRIYHAFRNSNIPAEYRIASAEHISNSVCPSFAKNYKIDWDEFDSTLREDVILNIESIWLD